MNSCPDKKTLNLYFLNLLDEKEKEKIGGHILSCDKCLKEYKIEKEIKKNLSLEIEPEGIEKIVLKKLQIYKDKPKFSYALKFANLFLTSTVIIAVFLTLWFIFSNFIIRDIKIFKAEEKKALEIIISFYLKELSNFFNFERLKILYTLIGILFFIFNFISALKKYIYEKNFFR